MENQSGGKTSDNKLRLSIRRNIDFRTHLSNRSLKSEGLQLGKDDDKTTSRAAVYVHGQNRTHGTKRVVKTRDNKTLVVQLKNLQILHIKTKKYITDN